MQKNERNSNDVKTCELKIECGTVLPHIMYMKYYDDSHLQQANFDQISSHGMAFDHVKRCRSRI